MRQERETKPKNYSTRDRVSMQLKNEKMKLPPEAGTKHSLSAAMQCRPARKKLCTDSADKTISSPTCSLLGDLNLAILNIGVASAVIQHLKGRSNLIAAFVINN